MKHKLITTVSLVEAALVEADDFLTAGMIRKKIGRESHSITQALIHLRHHKAADCVEQAHRLWWFATPDSDNRITKHEERAMETRPRKRSSIHKTPKEIK